MLSDRDELSSGVRSVPVGRKGKRATGRNRLGTERYMVLTRVDHLGAMLQSDFDNLIPSQISTYWGVLAPFANDVGFIGLCFKHHPLSACEHNFCKYWCFRHRDEPGEVGHTLPVHAESVLITSKETESVRRIEQKQAERAGSWRGSLPEDSNCVERQLVSLDDCS